MFSRIKTLREAFQHFCLLIQKNYEEREARSIAQIVFKEILGYSTIDLILKENDLLPASMFEQLDYVAYQLNEHKPIQYIIGRTEFCGLQFDLNEHVLIPRPETEELVDWIVQEEQLKNRAVKILDIGTGSGCIPITLKYFSAASEVYTMDVSKDALAVAFKNANKNRVELNLIHQNILTTNSIDSDFDLVVSNPPYVLESEKTAMRKNVLDYEPSLALFVKDSDPLVFYKKIIQLIESSSKKSTVLYFEINEQYALELSQCFNPSKWAELECRKDLHGKDRMFRAKFLP